VRRGRPAKIDPALRVWYGHDLFYFSDAGARAKFLEDPLRYARAMTDPVVQTRFEPSKASPGLVHAARTYRFRSEVTRTTFRAHPDSFATRRGMKR
jgi:YHS domain-containing protein